MARQEFGGGTVVWAWETLILLTCHATWLYDNPLELHCIKKKSGEYPVVEMQTPTCIYIQCLGHVCGDTANEQVVELKITYVCLKCQRKL